MAIGYIVFGEGNFRVVCLAADTKPASPNGTTLVESDTGKFFNRTGGAWVEAFNPSYATGSGTATGTNTGDQTSVSGSAGTLSPGRNINGVLFDGSTNITVTAAGSTLTGTTIAAGMLGTTASTACAGNDARLSDARAPTAHTHPVGEINGFPGGTTTFWRADGAFAAPPAPPNTLYAPGSVTVATGNFQLHVKRLQLTGAQRLTVAGTGRFRGMN